ncbi:MAG: hypothetical protein RIR97_1565 [Pseudomonadota bacterium]
MNIAGTCNPELGLDLMGFANLQSAFFNLSESELYEEAVSRKEAVITADGALRALTGQHTGRSAKDKFVVRDKTTESQIWWDNNKPMSPENFATLHKDMLAHAAGMSLYVQDLVGGADAENALPTRVITELAWHSLFIRNLLIRPDRATLESFVPKLQG